MHQTLIALKERNFMKHGILKPFWLGVLIFNKLVTFNKRENNSFEGSMCNIHGLVLLSYYLTF